MSRFSQSLTQVLIDRGWTQSKFAALTGFELSRANRWVTGTVAPRPESLDQLLKVFEPADQARLLVAYLRDEVPPAYERLVNITVSDSTPILNEAGPSTPSPAPPEGLSADLLSQLYRVAGVARDVPEVAAIFAEFDSLIGKAQKAGRI